MTGVVSVTVSSIGRSFCGGSGNVASILSFSVVSKDVPLSGETLVAKKPFPPDGIPVAAELEMDAMINSRTTITDTSSLTTSGSTSVRNCNLQSLA